MNHCGRSLTGRRATGSQNGGVWAARNRLLGQNTECICVCVDGSDAHERRQFTTPDTKLPATIALGSIDVIVEDAEQEN